MRRAASLVLLVFACAALSCGKKGPPVLKGHGEAPGTQQELKQEPQKQPSVQEKKQP